MDSFLLANEAQTPLPTIRIPSRPISPWRILLHFSHWLHSPLAPFSLLFHKYARLSQPSSSQSEMPPIVIYWLSK